MSLSASAIAGIAGASGGLLGGILNTGANMWSARLSRENANRQAQIQREWEERMSSTAVSRLVKDMQNAGLNPALLYSNGMSQSSTPSGGFGGNSAVGQGSLPISNSLSGLFEREESDFRNANSAFERDSNNNKSKMERLIKRAELEALNDNTMSNLIDTANSAIVFSNRFEQQAREYYRNKDFETGDKFARMRYRFSDLADDLLHDVSSRYSSEHPFNKRFNGGK